MNVTSTIWVKVLGFSDAERHSLNTLFRLSAHHDAAYALWTADVGAPPNVALVDVDSYEADLDRASPSFNGNLKRICVGSRATDNAWRSLQRPVDWNMLVQVLDELFASQEDVDIDIFEEEPSERTVPPGVKVSLVVGLTREERLYLRARLALAGLLDVDDAETAVEASVRISQRHYDLVIISLELADAEPWALVQTLQDMPTPTGSVIVVTALPSWRAMEQAERLGCTGLLEIPFNPRQVMDLLERV